LNTTNGTMTMVPVNSSNTPVQVIINLPAQPGGLLNWQTFASSNGRYGQASTTTITNGAANVSVPGSGAVTVYGLAAPMLTAAVAANGQINMLSPPSAHGFLLQSTTSLVSSSLWTNIGSSQLTSNGVSSGLVSVTVAGNAGTAFFRLAHP
jgi:hypothetical protein